MTVFSYIIATFVASGIVSCMSSFLAFASHTVQKTSHMVQKTSHMIQKTSHMIQETSHMIQKRHCFPGITKTDNGMLNQPLHIRLLCTGMGHTLNCHEDALCHPRPKPAPQ